jgi:hypothetical protein
MSIRETLKVYEKLVDEKFPEKGKMLVLIQGKFKGEISYNDYPQAVDRKQYSNFINWVRLPEQLIKTLSNKKPRNKIVSLSEIRESRENTLTLFEARFDLDGNLLIHEYKFKINLYYGNSSKYIDFIGLYENAIAIAFLTNSDEIDHPIGNGELSYPIIKIDYYKYNTDGLFISQIYVCTEKVNNLKLDTLNKGREILLTYNDITDTGALFKRRFSFNPFLTQ